MSTMTDRPVRARQSRGWSRDEDHAFDQRGLYYRGRDVAELAEDTDFRVRCGVTVGGRSRGLSSEEAAGSPPSYAKLRRGLPSAGGEQAMALFPLIERANPRPMIFQGGLRAHGWRFVALVCGHTRGGEWSSDASGATNHRRVAGAPKGFDDIIRRLLIVAADHEFDRPPTRCVRRPMRV